MTRFSADSADLVGAGESKLRQGGDRLRRVGAVRENVGYGAELLFVGADLLRREEVRCMRQDHRVPATECPVGNPAKAGNAGGAVAGKTVGKPGGGEVPGA